MRASLIVLCVALAPAPLAAQDPRSQPLPSAELGVGVAWTWAADDDSGHFYGGKPGLELRLSKPLTPRFELEGILVFGTPGGYIQATGSYFVLVKQRPRARDRKRLRPFVTYGLAGLFGRDFLPPALTVAGFGYEYQLTDRIAIRGDVQAVTLLYWPVGARMSASGAIPFR